MQDAHLLLIAPAVLFVTAVIVPFVIVPAYRWHALHRGWPMTLGEYEQWPWNMFIYWPMCVIRFIALGICILDALWVGTYWISGHVLTLTEVAPIAAIAIAAPGVALALRGIFQLDQPQVLTGPPLPPRPREAVTVDAEPEDR